MSEPHHDEVLRRLTGAFPGTAVWFGCRTRHWWALAWLAGGWRLIEATTPDGLVRALIDHRYPEPADRGLTRWPNHS